MAARQNLYIAQHKNVIAVWNPITCFLYKNMEITKWLWTCLYSKQIFSYFVVSESFLCIVLVMLLVMYIIKVQEVFETLPPTHIQSSLRPPADFQNAFYMAQRLQTLPSNYPPTEKSYLQHWAKLDGKGMVNFWR